MGIRNLIRWNRLGLALRRLVKALKKESEMANGYSYWITLVKGFRILGWGALTTGLGAVGLYLANPEVVSQALKAGGLSPQVVAPVTLILTMLGAMLRDWQAHRNGK